MTIDPDVILIGGGMSANPNFVPGVKKYVDKIRKITKTYDGMVIDTCKFRNDSNLLLFQFISILRLFYCDFISRPHTSAYSCTTRQEDSNHCGTCGGKIMIITKKHGLPENFLWGASTSAYQVEGANLSYGKGPSVQDIKTVPAGTSDVDVCADF